VERDSTCDLFLTADAVMPRSWTEPMELRRCSAVTLSVRVACVPRRGSCHRNSAPGNEQRLAPRPVSFRRMRLSGSSYALTDLYMVASFVRRSPGHRPGTRYSAQPLSNRCAVATLADASRRQSDQSSENGSLFLMLIRLSSRLPGTAVASRAVARCNDCVPLP
jgi:hypothetical protein